MCLLYFSFRRLQGSLGKKESTTNIGQTKCTAPFIKYGHFELCQIRCFWNVTFSFWITAECDGSFDVGNSDQMNILSPVVQFLESQRSTNFNNGGMHSFRAFALWILWPSENINMTTVVSEM